MNDYKITRFNQYDDSLIYSFCYMNCNPMTFEEVVKRTKVAKSQYKNYKLGMGVEEKLERELSSQKI